MAKFMEGRRGDGLSDDMFTVAKRAHMSQNWALNPTFEGVAPHVNVVGGGDNTGYRVMPGRKKGMYSG